MKLNRRTRSPGSVEDRPGGARAGSEHEFTIFVLGFRIGNISRFSCSPCFVEDGAGVASVRTIPRTYISLLMDSTLYLTADYVFARSCRRRRRGSMSLETVFSFLGFRKDSYAEKSKAVFSLGKTG